MYVCVSILSCVCVYVYVWAYILLSDHVPRAKEIWLVLITNAEISHKISSSQRNFQTSFHGIPPQIHTKFAGSNGSLCHSKELTGELPILEMLIWYGVALVSRIDKTIGLFCTRDL